MKGSSGSSAGERDDMAVNGPLMLEKGPFSSRKVSRSSGGEPLSSIIVTRTADKGSFSDERGPFSSQKVPCSSIKGPAPAIQGSISDVDGPFSDVDGPFTAEKGPLSSSKGSRSPKGGPLSAIIVA
jgi:hypothetical protein